MLSLPAVESTYDRLAEAIDNAPAGQSELMLVKLALLLANEVGDAARVAALIDAALADLNTTPKRGAGRDEVA
jgi:Protein of unknown function (DUF2783)